MTKFRAFDKQTNHMYYPPNEHIYLNIDGTCVNFQNGEILEAMLWTGEVDIKKNDIYRCDIVKLKDGITIVKWEDSCFCMDVPKQRHLKIPEAYFCSESVVLLHELEVIGNTKQHKIEDFT